MKFNSLIPELSVKSVEKTKYFYVEILGFYIEYERIEDKFIFLSYGESQFMFEEIHDNGWNIGELKYPLERGVNFSILSNRLEELYEVIKDKNIKIYRELKENRYLCRGKEEVQREFLIQDPDGYLLRFTD